MLPELVTLHHELELPLPPAAVFELLMDSEQHADLTGMDAEIDWREGGKFFTCGGRSHGFTVALVTDHCVVQAWVHARFSPGQYTLVTFELESTAAGTRLRFTQVGVPKDAEPWLADGWREHYWLPLSRFGA